MNDDLKVLTSRLPKQLALLCVLRTNNAAQSCGGSVSHFFDVFIHGATFHDPFSSESEGSGGTRVTPQEWPRERSSENLINGA
jgi:hypothetical protein